MSPRDEERFDRQIRFAPLGRAGQQRLEEARVLLVGCGALGGVLAQSLARAGVGELLLADRDIVELSNLPRQVLFDDRQAAEGAPKALAAAESLERAGGPTRITAHAVHVDARNLAELAQGVDLVLDGTDNLETRYLINDFAIDSRTPWIYAGVVGGSGLVMPVLPDRGPCLRCVFPDPPPPGTLATCDSAGVILPAVGAVASMAAGLALRILGQDPLELEPALIELDAWNGVVRRLSIPRDPACPACAQGELPFLRRSSFGDPVILCGRNTVQIPAGERPPDLEALAANIPAGASGVVRSSLLLRFGVEGLRLTLFRDGRALIEGTDSADRARAIYDRLVGT